MDGGNRDTRAVFLRSDHPKIFCAGANLKERLGMSRTEILSFLDLFRRTLNSLESIPVPTFALIEGAALGGGLEIALACDFRVSKSYPSPSSDGGSKSPILIGLPETKLAIIPGAGGTQRLLRLIGPSKSKALIFEGRRLDALKAYELGIVDYLAEGEETVEERAGKAVQAMVDAGPVALKAAKGAINEGMELGDLDEALDVERKFYEQVLDTQDRVEGLKAFVEKRKPEYRGV
ncbi:ClpP/crotonase [Atractiella rhizophila]|nr:ClpP/crotonase [Atractiella rhizophila]